MTAPDLRYSLRTNTATPSAVVVRADDLLVADVLEDGRHVVDVHVGQEIEPGRRVVYVWTDDGRVDAHVADALVTVTTSATGRAEIEVDQPTVRRREPADARTALEASVGRYTLAAVAAARTVTPGMAAHVLAVGIAQGFAGGNRVTVDAVSAFLPQQTDTIRDNLYRLAMDPPTVLERDTDRGRSLYGIRREFVES